MKCGAVLAEQTPTSHIINDGIYYWICSIFVLQNFYRAMRFSAKRGIAIACCLSVCP